MPRLSRRSALTLVISSSLATPVTAVTPIAATPAAAEVRSWPAAFHAHEMPVSGGTQYVRAGGHGPAVVLLHGFGDTCDMWVPLAAGW